MSNVFERIEKKYMLTRAQAIALSNAFCGRLAQDQYGLHTINNLYLDTGDYALIRASIEKPVYKEKMRLRAYGTPREGSTVFLELKKKYKGVVYKRRVAMTLASATAYLGHGERPQSGGQILREMDWFRAQYDVTPKAFIAYDRTALYGLDDPELRVTFDDNIRYRLTQLDLSKGSWGTQLLPADQVLMEIKMAGAMPLWLARTLSDLSITPTSFSKYGMVYKEAIHPYWNQPEEIAHVS